MFKKSICLILALLLCAGFCACSRKAESAATTVNGAAQSTTIQAASQEQKSAEKNQEQKKNQKKKNKTTTAEAGKKSADKANKSAAKAPAEQPESSKKKSTTTTQKTTQKPTKKEQPQKSTADVTFTIDCSAAMGEIEGLPSSGYFLRSAGVSVSKGASVYEALLKCCDANGVSVVASNTMYGMYVSAIGGLAEKEVGKMSGWTYTVNGKYPPKACDKYALSDGDAIVFIYKV